MKWILDSSGNIDGWKISNQQVDDTYFISDAFLDTRDTTGGTYLDSLWLRGFSLWHRPAAFLAASGLVPQSDIIGNRNHKKQQVTHRIFIMGQN